MDPRLKDDIKFLLVKVDKFKEFIQEEKCEYVKEEEKKPDKI